MNLHDATLEDAEFIFELRNLDSNRVHFRNPAKLVWESHLLWMTSFFSNSKNRIYIFSINNEKIGMFKVDLSGDVGISLLDAFKGKGYGGDIVKIGTSRYLNEYPSTELFAEVKLENVASLRVFEKAGYKTIESKNENYILLNYVGKK